MYAVFVTNSLTLGVLSIAFTHTLLIEARCPDPSDRLCRDGTCIAQADLSTSRCTDEPCPLSTEYPCDLGTRCVSIYMSCDGTADCSDGSDEQGCGHPDEEPPTLTPTTPEITCVIGQTKCQDICIDDWRRCPDDPCPYYASWRCDGGSTCLPLYSHCDGTATCRDWTDENDCAEDADDSTKSPTMFYILVAVFFAVVLAGVVIIVVRRYLKIRHYLQAERDEERNRNRCTESEDSTHHENRANSQRDLQGQRSPGADDPQRSPGAHDPQRSPSADDPPPYHAPPSYDDAIKLDIIDSNVPFDPPPYSSNP